MSLTCPSVFQVVESSVEIVCESTEDKMSPSEVMILKFPSSNMSIAFLDLSIENQKGGYIKPNRIKLLKYSFSLSGTLSLLGSLLSVPFCRLFHIDECHRSG